MEEEMHTAPWKTGLALLAAVTLAFGAVGLSAGAAMAAPTVQGEEPEEIEFTGVVTAFDESAGTIEVDVETDDEGTLSYSVHAPEDFDFSLLEVGDVVKVEGTVNEDGTINATRINIEEPDDEDGEDGEDDDGEDGEDEENFFCANPDASHPVGQSIAERYGLTYEEVMAWFCEGEFGFGQIMLALQTSGITGDSADDLLARRAGGEGWGQIWQDLDLIGRPEDAGPPEWAGRPEGAGPPEDRGRPEGAGPPDGSGPPPWAGGPPPWAGPPNQD
jgi:hypothetical protein